MRRMVIGIVIGLSIGSVVRLVAASLEPKTSGYMIGWTVKITTSEGVEVKCDDPFIWPTIKEIECDGGEIE